MSYRYEDLRPKLFTEEGSVIYIEIRDRVNKLLKESGAVTTWAACNKTSGDSWLALACLDRMVEVEEIHEVTGPGTWGQNRVFTR